MYIFPEINDLPNVTPHNVVVNVIEPSLSRYKYMVPFTPDLTMIIVIAPSLLSTSSTLYIDVCHT
jgi:hypothetical protein